MYENYNSCKNSIIRAFLFKKKTLQIPWGFYFFTALIEADIPITVLMGL